MTQEKPLATLRIYSFGTLVLYVLIGAPLLFFTIGGLWMFQEALARLAELNGPTSGFLAVSIAGVVSLAVLKMKNALRMPRFDNQGWASWAIGSGAGAALFAWGASNGVGGGFWAWIPAGVIIALVSLPLIDLGILGTYAKALLGESAGFAPLARVFSDRLEVRGCDFPFSEFLTFEYVQPGTQNFGLKISSPYATRTVPLGGVFVDDARWFVGALRDAHPSAATLRDPEPDDCQGMSVGFNWALLIGLALLPLFLWAVAVYSILPRTGR